MSLQRATLGLIWPLGRRRTLIVVAVVVVVAVVLVVPVEVVVSMAQFPANAKRKELHFGTNLLLLLAVLANVAPKLVARLGVNNKDVFVGLVVLLVARRASLVEQTVSKWACSV